MELLAREAANGASMALHEIRVSVATLKALGVACFEPRLLIGGLVLCHASAEEQIKDEDVFILPWLLMVLGLTPGSCVEIRVDVSPRSSPRSAQNLRLDLLHGVKASESGNESSDCDSNSDDEVDVPDERRNPLSSLMQQAGSAAATAAVHRQLRGLLVRRDVLVAVECLGGITLIQVAEAVGTSGGEACEDMDEALEVTNETSVEIVYPKTTLHAAQTTGKEDD